VKYIIIKKKFEKALEYYDKALDLETDNVIILNNKALVLCKLNRLENSLGYYNKTLKLDSDNEYALEGREEVLKKIKNND
jgi:tetratricopeptide (TPR) repeat protein